MKKVIVIIVVILGCVVIPFTIGFFSNNNLTEIAINNMSVMGNKQEKDYSNTIKVPDRIIFKHNSDYYKIMPNYENYYDLIHVCINGMKSVSEYDIVEQEIDQMKGENDFIEFDYDTVSKNNIFLLSSKVGTIQMKDTDGLVISKELKNKDEILEKYIKAIENQEPRVFNHEMYRVNDINIDLMKITNFKCEKFNEVYERKFENLEEYNQFINISGLQIDESVNIAEKIKNNNIILILSKYDVSEYKVNIGNIKIKFSNEVIKENEVYRPFLFVVSDVVNANCVYYEYEL